jgi:uncharacterized protein
MSSTGLVPGRAQCLCGPPRSRLIPIQYHNGRASFGQHDRDTSADATCAPGDERDFSGEIEKVVGTRHGASQIPSAEDRVNHPLFTGHFAGAPPVPDVFGWSVPRGYDTRVPVTSTLWLLLVSAATSALGGVLGMASGIFIVPVLTLFGHYDIHTAISASLISVIACSCGSAAPFLRERLTNIRLAVVLEVATTLGALSGALLFGLVPIQWLYLLFAVILFLSAQQMIMRRRAPAAAGGAVDTDVGVPNPTRWHRLDSTYPDREKGVDMRYAVGRLPLGMVLMYGAGFVSALLGIGSGVLKIPAMDTALRLPIKVSSATSNFMIGVTAAASAGAYYARDLIDPVIAGPVALGSVVGALVGARLLMAVPGERLRVLFVVVLVLLGIQMVLSAFGIHLLAQGGA